MPRTSTARMLCAIASSSVGVGYRFLLPDIRPDLDATLDTSNASTVATVTLRGSRWAAKPIICLRPLRCQIAQERGVEALLQKFARSNLVVGHSGSPRVVVASRKPTRPTFTPVAASYNTPPDTISSWDQADAFAGRVSAIVK